jgi:hypothetical protein
MVNGSGGAEAAVVVVVGGVGSPWRRDGLHCAAVDASHSPSHSPSHSHSHSRLVVRELRADSRIAVAVAAAPTDRIDSHSHSHSHRSRCRCDPCDSISDTTHQRPTDDMTTIQTNTRRRTLH